MGRRRGWLVALTVAIGTACAATPADQLAPAAAAAAVPPTVGHSVWVTVNVATLWTSPTAPRRIDAPALQAPARIRRWLSDMTTTARRGLVGRVETQALYGERLLVTGVRTGWLHVVATNQPTRRDRRGYPGWVPTRQVTTTAPVTAPAVATVTRLTTWLRGASGRPIVEVSEGTRLPVLVRGVTKVAVASPTHVRLFVRASDVIVRKPTEAALPVTAAGVVATARTFLGVGYLWGGRSGFGVDCSGLTQLAYKLHGRTIPRDADDQARAGRAVPLSSLRVADLVFFREGATIGHVGIDVGSGRMLHAPSTGLTVRISSVGRPTMARRFL